MNENANVAMFAANLLHISTNTHFFHCANNSYSQHKSLCKYYDEIIELVDDYVEAYMGCYEQIKEFPSVYHQPKEPLKYLESLKNFVAEANADLPQKQELINIVAEIQQLIDSTIFKLKYLK